MTPTRNDDTRAIAHLWKARTLARQLQRLDALDALVAMGAARADIEAQQLLRAIRAARR
jgi:hypothetical protein